MLKQTLLPILFFGLLASCGKKDSPPQVQAQQAPQAQAAAAPTAAPSAEGNLLNGERAYKNTCAMCHGTGAGGAPALKKADWEPRLAQGKETLYGHALNGFTGSSGVMPPKGGNSSLKDEDVKAAVDYMVSQAK